MNYKCVTCGQIKQKINSQIKNSSNNFIYIDEDNRRWKGAKCPDCRKIQHREYIASRRLNVVYNIKCKNCNVSIITNKKRQQFCSNSCRGGFNTRIKRNKLKMIKPPRLPKPPRIRYKKKTYSLIQCCTCGKDFVPKHPSAKACKTTCAPSYKKAKKFRRSIARCKQQKISKQYKKQIVEIYIGCPAGHHVDHIIPLKGRNVSGLHVPWNLQYLTAAENIKKSNKV